MRFAENLTQMMEKQGLSPYSLSQKIGVTKKTVAGWLSGAEPRAAAYKAVADYFGVSVSQIKNDDLSDYPFTPQSEQKESPTPNGAGVSLTDYELEAVSLMRRVPDEKKADALRVIRALGEDAGLLKKP